MGNLDSTSGTAKKPIVLNSWATCLEDGTYCRVEEYDLKDIHFKAVVHIDAKENGCRFCPYKKESDIPVITSSIWNVKGEDIFVTQYGNEYRLGDPHPVYKKLFGGLGEAELISRLINVVQKKRNLL